MEVRWDDNKGQAVPDMLESFGQEIKISGKLVTFYKLKYYYVFRRTI
jgi:hypothetical protein